jgi:hypothetical protein
MMRKVSKKEMKVDGVELTESKTIWLDPRLICKGIYKVITEKQAKKIASKSKENGIYEVNSVGDSEKPFILTRSK